MKHNPFSTRKTTPGKIPYHFGSEVISCRKYGDRFYNDLYSSLRTIDFQSQIVGGHGTGKTTFLIGLICYLENRKHTVNHISLHDGQRLLPRKFWERHIRIVSQFKIGAIENLPIDVLDGYEQLSLAQKIRLRLACQKKKCGLLITTHNPAWRLPVLLHTEPTFQTLQAIVRYLFRDQSDLEPPDENLCRSLFERHQSNIRSALFDLYDEYEKAASGFGLPPDP